MSFFRRFTNDHHPCVFCGWPRTVPWWTPDPMRNFYIQGEGDICQLCGMKICYGEEKEFVDLREALVREKRLLLRGRPIIRIEKPSIYNSGIVLG